MNSSLIAKALDVIVDESLIPCSAYNSVAGVNADRTSELLPTHISLYPESLGTSRLGSDYLIVVDDF